MLFVEEVLTTVAPYVWPVLRLFCLLGRHLPISCAGSLNR